MKSTILTLLFVSTSAFAELVTVPYVDVGQYLGTWYQVARKPIVFENGCVCSRQVLSATPDGRVSVYNSCNDQTASGPLREIRGFATNDDPVSNSKFTVDFGLPKKGAYWIIGLDHNYRYAVVSDPTKASLYILSKTPVLDSALYSDAITKAAEQVDVSSLSLTKQEDCVYP